ncbi:hypothetical protein [Neptunitalea chrysea]|nr:hypothetical protein [Neptunitalea chrysea]
MILIFRQGFSQQTTLQSFKAEIVGVWQSDEDAKYIIEFTDNGNRIDKYLGYSDTEYTYELTTGCDFEVVDGEDVKDIFLKTYENGSDSTCDIINNISTNNTLTTLSITGSNGKLYLFTKQ